MARQIVITRKGGPEVFADRDLPERALAAGEVRIAVEAAGVNFADVAGRLGNYPDAPPIPYAPGYEVSGTIREVGEGADAKVGDRVCALVQFGGYADEIVARADAIFKLPDGVATDVAAGVPVTYLTAHTCMFDAGALTAGKRVLILGGAGGVGSAAIQLAKKAGVRILATAGGADKCKWMTDHGVEVAIDHQREDVAARVKDATGGKGVDAVLDPIGGRGLATSIAMCAPLGRVILFGASSMSPGKTRRLSAIVREGLPMRFFNLVPLFNANVGIHAINMLHLALAEPALMQTKMAAILGGIAAGEYAPVIAERYSLDAAGAIAAHHLLQDRKNIGKVLLVRAPKTKTAA